MKICIIGAKNYPPRDGGIETHIFKISPILAVRGHDVTVVTGKEKGQPSEEVMDGVRILRVPLIQHHYLASLSKLPMLVMKASPVKADVYHCHGGLTSFFCSLFLEPLVFTVHGLGHQRTDWPKIMLRLAKFIEIFTIKKASFNIAVDHLTLDIIKPIRDDSVVIPNGITIHEGDRNRMEVDRTGPLNILYVGRLIESKGSLFLTEAFNSLPPEYREKCELWLVGDGPLKDKLNSMTKDVKNVHVTGFVDSTEPFFKKADIFVLPSLYEGLPFTLLEAMSTGTACISNKIGDIPKRFTEEEILFVDSLEKEQLRDALMNLIDDGELRRGLSERAFEKIEQEYDWGPIVTQIEDIYRSIER